MRRPPALVLLLLSACGSQGGSSASLGGNGAPGPQVARGGAVVAAEEGAAVRLTRLDGASLAVGLAEARGYALAPWWTEAGDGVEVGWTVRGAPGVVEVVVPHPGARVTVAGRRATVEGADGRRWTVGALAAWDARGVPLASTWTGDGEALHIVVDASGATFPVTVDPVYSAAMASWSGEDALSRFGGAVLGAGDVDGDGWPDLAVAAPGYADYTGRVYGYGGASGGPVATFVLDGATPETLYGYSLAAGDFDGDGLQDLAVGIPGESDFSGAVALYDGSAAGPVSAGVLASSSTEEQLGWSAASVGDVDGDGYDDLLVGANGWYGDIGRAYLYVGGPGGLPADPTDTVTGETASDRLGDAVAGLGDVNGDGYADVAIGAPGVTRATGEVVVYQGGAAGLPLVASATITGLESGSSFGNAVAGAGDVDADGYDDLVVGAPSTQSDRGAVFFYRGGAAGVSTAPDQSLSGAAPGDYFGWSVAGAGDLDLDGYADLLVGSSGAFGALGRVDEYDGGVAGLTARTTLSGAVADGGFGAAVAAVGDVDGDGFVDVAVGADNEAGSAYVYGGYRDMDDDGASSLVDCDDTVATVYPGAPEVVADGVDQDCDGGDTCYVDGDGDGWRPDVASTVASPDLSCADPGEADRSASVGDCDDASATVHPRATEVPGDEIDQSCDGRELCYADADLDGYANAVGATVLSTDVTCADPGESTTVGADCDDADATIFPGAPESVADGVDQDCDGGDTCFVDADGDAWRPDETSTVPSPDLACDGAGEADATVPVGDCDDTAFAAHPGATERIGDGIDEDCDGIEMCYGDGDDDGARTDAIVASTGTTCDGAGLSGRDADKDCDDADPTVHPGAPEVVDDGVDQDCDGGDTCYPDADADGFRPDDGTLASADLDCADPGEAPADLAAGDCDDTRADVHPGAREIPDDGVDEDCDHADLTKAVPSKDVVQTCGCATGGPVDGGAGGVLGGAALGVALLVGRRRP